MTSWLGQRARDPGQGIYAVCSNTGFGKWHRPPARGFAVESFPAGAQVTSRVASRVRPCWSAPPRRAIDCAAGPGSLRRGVRAAGRASGHRSATSRPALRLEQDRSPAALPDLPGLRAAARCPATTLASTLRAQSPPSAGSPPRGPHRRRFAPGPTPAATGSPRASTSALSPARLPRRVTSSPARPAAAPEPATAPGGPARTGPGHPRTHPAVPAGQRRLQRHAAGHGV